MHTLFRKVVASILTVTVLSSLVVFANDREEVFVYGQDNVSEFQEKTFDNFRYLPGDRIVFKAGTIHIKDVGRWGKINYLVGTKEHPIIIEGETGPNGELLTTLDGEGFDLYGMGSSSRDLLGIEQGQYVIIRNLRFVNAWNSTGNAGGIRFVGGDNLVVENCYFENTQNGVFTYGSGKVTIKNSYFKRAGYFNEDGGGHSVYLENEEVYFVGNHVENSQFHSFRTRASYTYMENNYIENGGNTEVSLFGGAKTTQPNSNVVMVGNVIIKQPSQRADGLPGNKYQFIQIGERTTPFNVYAYNNTFILDQTVASDNGTSQKNAARLFMFSDGATNSNARVSIKNNVIYGSDKLANEGQQGSGEFSNNIYMSGSAIPSGWSGTGNVAVSDASIFNDYVVNGSNGLTIDGLKLKDESILAPIPANELFFTDKSGTDRSLANGLYNETNFSYHFEKGMRQMRSKLSDRIERCTIRSVGFADNAPVSSCSYPNTIDPTTPPGAFSGFTVSGDSRVYQSLSETPTGRWLEISNSKMRDVVSPRSYDSPVRAWGSIANIMGAWSGGGYDTKRDRLYVWGGGNMDYGGNDLYAFDLNTLAWKRLRGPSFPSQGTPLIATGATRYFDGAPRSRNTFDMVEYDPVSDQFCALGETGVYPSGNGGNNVDCYDPNTNEWKAKNNLIQTMQFGASAYDGETRMLYEFSMGGTPKLARYDATNDAWTYFTPRITYVPNVISESWFPYGYVGEVDPVSKKMVLVNGANVFAIELPSNGSGSEFRPSTEFHSGAISYGWLGRSPGILYDPIAKKMVLWGGKRELGVLDPSNWSYSRVTSPGDLAPFTAQAGGTYGRFRYSAKYDAYVLANSIDQNVWIYRPDRTAENHIGPAYSGTDSTIGGTDSATGTGTTGSWSNGSGTTDPNGSGVTPVTSSGSTGKTYQFNTRNFSSFADLFFNNLVTAPGDRFVFASGTYTLKSLVSSWPKINNLSGSLANPIVIEGAVGPNGELHTTFDGAGFSLDGNGSNARDLLDVENSNYVIIRNIRFKNAAGNSGNSAGIRFIRGDNLLVDHCAFENDQNGVFAYGSKRLTIKNSLFNGAGYFSTTGGGHGVYLETEELYFIGNHMVNSQFHNFRSRAGFTYMQNNYLENAANTEISLFGGATTNQPNANFVMVGNVVIKKPSQRADGLPGNSSQFIQIGERTTPFNVYAYNNTFILDQTVASDNGTSQKNDARLFMFSDTNTHNNARSYIKNNVIYGSVRLADATKQGSYAEFANNVYMSGSAIPSNWTATGNLAINGPEIFRNYAVNTGNGLTLSGLLLTSQKLLRPIPASQLSFVDKSGREHYLSYGLLRSEENFTYVFDRNLSQMADKQAKWVSRTTQKSVGFADDTTPKAFTGFAVVGDASAYQSPESLPKGKWLEIADTKMQAVTEPEFYEWPVRAIVGPRAIIDAWGGGALDTNRQRMYVFGGGHGDYAGNEVYSFDINQMRWDRLTDPSMPPPGVSMVGTGVRNYDGSMLSRHTYDMLEFDPVTDQFCALGQSAIYPSGWGGYQVDCFDPKTNMWTRKKDLTQGISYGHSLYDPVDEVFYAFSAGGTYFGRYDPKTDTWTRYRFNLRDGYPDMNDSSFPLYFVAELDAVHRTMVVTNSVGVVTIPLPSKDQAEGSNLNPTYDTGTFAPVMRAYTGTHAYPGVAFDPIDKRFTIWHSGPNLYHYDAGTKSVSYETIPGGENVAILPDKGTYGRFRYSAKYDMYVLISDFDKNVFVYKPERGGGTAGWTGSTVGTGSTTGSGSSSGTGAATETGTTSSGSAAGTGTTSTGSSASTTPPATSGSSSGGGGGGSVSRYLVTLPNYLTSDAGSGAMANPRTATASSADASAKSLTGAKIEYTVPQSALVKNTKPNYYLPLTQKKALDTLVAKATKNALSLSAKNRTILEIIASIEKWKIGKSEDSRMFADLAIRHIRKQIRK